LLATVMGMASSCGIDRLAIDAFTLGGAIFKT